MTTVRQLAERLAQYPDDAEVMAVGVHSDGALLVFLPDDREETLLDDRI